MSKKYLASLMAVIVLTVSLSQQAAADFTIPDIGEVASDITSGIEESLSEVASGIGTTASDTVEQISDIASGFATGAGDVISEWGEHAGETADNVKDVLSEAGITVQVAAEQFGSATADKVADLTEKAGKTAEEAINAVSEASDYVLDHAGHVVDLAAAGGEYVSSTAIEALQIIKEQGQTLVTIAEDAVAGMDLSKQENWEQAKVAVDKALSDAFDKGLLKARDEETIRVVTRIVFGAMMYSYQYSNGVITLGEYVGGMSEVLIKEGLPTGVGFIISSLPFVPESASSYAKQVAYYLIALAYGDKPGDEIVTEEDGLFESVLETVSGWLEETETE